MTPKTDKVYVNRQFACSASELFKWLTNPELLVQWFWPNKSEALSAVCDASPNGKYAVNLKSPNGQLFSMEGRFLEVVPASKIVYDYEYKGLATHMGRSLVTLNLNELTTTSTELQVIHEFELAGPDSERRTEVWHAMFDMLLEITG